MKSWGKELVNYCCKFKTVHIHYFTGQSSGRRHKTSLVRVSEDYIKGIVSSEIQESS